VVQSGHIPLELYRIHAELVVGTDFHWVSSLLTLVVRGSVELALSSLLSISFCWNNNFASEDDGTLSHFVPEYWNSYWWSYVSMEGVVSPNGYDADGEKMSMSISIMIDQHSKSSLDCCGMNH